MAKKAKPEGEEQQAAVVEKPDFDKALRIYTGDIKPSSDDMASARGSIANAYKAIEKECRCNRQGFKSAVRVMEMSEEAGDDFLRTFLGVLQAAGRWPREDLVDLMESDGKTPAAAPSKVADLATLQ